MDQPRILIGVLSRKDDIDRKKAIRETWGGVCKNHGIDLVFLCGNENSTSTVLSGDVLNLPCPDDYAHLPMKSRLFFRWFLESPKLYTHAFKCDDDTFVMPSRLASFVRTTKFDFAGKMIMDNIASGGAGYILSRMAAHVIVDHLTQTTGAEDVLVGQTLRQKSSYRLVNSNRFDHSLGLVRRIPTKTNDMITCHYVQPDLMRTLHKDLHVSS